MLHFDNNRGRRVNQEQKNILYAAMAANRRKLELRSGDTDTDPRQVRKEVWKRVTHELNMAGPEKDIPQWKKVWTDLRLGMRKKWNKSQQSGYILTEYERRVIDACGMVEQSGDDYKSAEEINSFLDFLQKEPIHDEEECMRIKKYSEYLKDGNSDSDSNYLNDPSEFIICEPTEVNIKDEFDEEPTTFVECISDDDDDKQTATFQKFRETSVESISDDDDEDPMITNDLKLESSIHSSYEAIVVTENEEPVVTENEPQAQPRPPTQLLPSSPSIININQPRRRKLKNSTLKGIWKMQSNLLKESKKQTYLLKKLVKGMQQQSAYTKK